MKGLVEHLGLPLEAVTCISPGITTLSIPSACLHASVKYILQTDSITYLSAIIGQEMDDDIELIYLFTGNTDLALRVHLPKDQPTLESVSDLNRAASFYEREAREMLGVIFLGLDEPENLLLPKDSHETPLRKKFVKKEV